jgi:hypothetical protein
MSSPASPPEAVEQQASVPPTSPIKEDHMENTQEKSPERNNDEHTNGHDNDGRETHENGSEIQFLPSAASGGPDLGIPGSKNGTIYREKQVKPNKVYIGGLPEHTRQEDLRNCFGKLGDIVNIELKSVLFY